MFVKKIIDKEKLNDNSVAMARRECSIHSELKHENIAELIHYCEGENSIELIVEHCNNPTYFEDRLEEVKNH